MQSILSFIFKSPIIMYKAYFGPALSERTCDQKDKSDKEEFRPLLTEERTPLFNILRKWRNEKALKDTVPAYIMFSNKQLAVIAAKSPMSNNQLGLIEGVGKGGTGSVYLNKKPLKFKQL